MEVTTSAFTGGVVLGIISYSTATEQYLATRPARLAVGERLRGLTEWILAIDRDLEWLDVERCQAGAIGLYGTRA